MNGFIKLYSVLSSFETVMVERHNNKGITAIEYALMAAGIATIIAAALAILGPKVNAKFSGI